MAYDWPGNVRELRNVTERGMILCPGDTIPVACLPAELQMLAGTMPGSPPLPSVEPPAEAPEVGRSFGAVGTLEQMEQQYIREVLASVSGNRSQAARLLGISRSTLQDKIRRYGLS
jgi:DNA-binding NtrC family response regulator